MKRALLALAMLLCAAQAYGGGPRFVAGLPYGSYMGQPMAFYTPKLTYYTDPGDLSATVPHAQADAMVAAAAAAWNVPVALLTLAQGGVLAEHVSDQNTYFTGTQLVYPADVQASNYLSKPIAVIYDEDGSVTDMLLGEGASSPTSCHRNAVTASVDGFGSNATIQHAVLILNGLCVGPTPQQMLQMQYEVERGFGRVLGLAWSQLNDNVFTAVAPVTADQVNNWPIMHPIDVVCGSYTYQCMPDPFQLRPDDISALAGLYPVTAANLVAGKTLTLNANTIQIATGIYFPDLQGMSQVNLVLRQGLLGLSFNSFDTVGGVSGTLYQRNNGNPVTGPTPVSDMFGNTWVGLEASSNISWVPLVFAPGRITDVAIFAEAINPLYSGDDAVGTYEGTPVSLNTSVPAVWGLLSSANFGWQNYLLASSEPATCAASGDGTSTVPVAVPATGWWANALCPEGHVSWLTTNIAAGHSWTLETTATDETGAVSNTKMKPVLGVWLASDPTSALPTVAATPSPFNATSLGMTQLAVPAAAQAQAVRIAIADALGQGRPDFSYKARLLYAASVQPATVGAGGGTIRITGEGFRAGNQVLVNGVAATAVSWTANQIVAVAPTSAAAGGTSGSALDVTVVDASTGGRTNITGALSYSTAPDTLRLVGAPASLATGMASTTPFSVTVLASDGTPVAATPVRFTVAGPVTLPACAALPCVLTTNAAGVASTGVLGTAAGAVTLTATEPGGGATVSVTLTDSDPVRALSVSTPPLYVAAGAMVSWNVAAVASLNAAPAAGVAVNWTADPGLTLSAAQTTTAASGTANVSVQVGGLAGGAAGTVTGCAWSTVCAGATVYAVAAPLWTPAVTSGAGQSVAVGTTLQPVTVQVGDGAGHPLQGAPVTIYQTADAWEGSCPSHGACPSASVLQASTTTATTNAAGQVTVAPLQVHGVAQVVNIAVSTGTQGFVALTLDVTP